MEQEIRVTSQTLLKVKEMVDFIYEATAAEGGYKGGWSKYSGRFKKVATILSKRGVIVHSGYKDNIVYTWNKVATPPTKVFYKSVAQELLNGEKGARNRYRQKLRRQRDALKRAEAEKAAVEAEKERRQAEVLAASSQPAVGAESGQGTAMGVQYKENPLLKPDLRAFTDQELWDELKRRGARIVDGKMKVVKEIELS